MHRHRLDKLAKLTRGAALVGIGANVIACQHDATTVNAPPDPTPHMNAVDVPPTNAPSAASSAPTAEASATASAAPTHTHTINAPHVNAPPHVNAVRSDPQQKP